MKDKGGLLFMHVCVGGGEITYFLIGSLFVWNTPQQSMITLEQTKSKISPTFSMALVHSSIESRLSAENSL